MRNLLIVLFIMTLPLFAKAQIGYSRNTDMRNPFTGGIDRPELPKLETVKPIATLSSVEKAQAKLKREEQKLIKLANKTWDKEADLKTKQKELQNLENTPTDKRDPDYQKNIENLKKEITKSQEEVNKAKAEVELNSKKVEDLEKALEEAKYTRHGD